MWLSQPACGLESAELNVEVNHLVAAVFSSLIPFSDHLCDELTSSDSAKSPS
jgi:hypothetical protein